MSASPLGRRLGWLPIIVALGLATTVIHAPAAHAATETHTASVPSTQTAWTETVSVPQFDPALGELQAVTVELEGSLLGDMAIENFSTGSPSSATLELTGSVILTPQTATTSVIETSLGVTESMDLEVFDGTIDFSGTSGATLGGVTDSATASATFSDPSDLAAFIGTGTSDLDVAATSDNMVTSTAGNDISQFSVTAAAAIVVTYDYQVPSIQIDVTPDTQTVTPGDDVTFTIDVTNNGALDLVATEVTDATLSACDITIGDLAIGETSTYSCTADAVTDPFTHSAQAVGQTVQGTTVTDEDDAAVEVTGAQTTTTTEPPSPTTPPSEPTAPTNPPTTVPSNESLPVTGTESIDLAWLGIVVLSLGGAVLGIERVARNRREQS